MKKNSLKQNKPLSNKNIGYSSSSSTKLPLIKNKKAVSTAGQNQQNQHQLKTENYQDDGLIMLIHEYLIKNNLFDTLDTFQKDCLKGFKPTVKPIELLKKQLIECFDAGLRDLFFTKFNQYVGLSLRSKDPQTMKLQFYLQLYFFIYSTHPMLGKKKTVDTISKQQFIGYLQGKGSALAKQTQFLQYYALGYLQKPQQHPNFKQIFTKQWIQELKKQLVFFVDKLYPNGKISSLMHIYDKYIEHNLQAQKYSSVTLTEQDEENDILIEEQIMQENMGSEDGNDSIMNNPEPILLENSNNRNKPLNSSIQYEKGQGHSQGQQQQYIVTEKQHPEMLQLNDRVNELQEQKINLLNFIENSKNKYQNLQNDFRQFSGSIQNTLMQSQLKWFRITQELYNVAKDLLNASKSLMQGIPLADTQLITKRQEKLSRYESFVNMNVQDLLSDNIADYSLFERGEHDISVDMAGKRNNVSNNLSNNNMNEFYERDQKLMQVDFEKIKATMSRTITVSPNSQPEDIQDEQKQSDMEKCLLLQALRWRITRLRGTFQKRQVILSYTKNDILGLKDESTNESNNILNVLFSSKNPTILFYTTLFISALSKDYYGRQYLFNETLIKMLMQIRRKPQTDQKIKGIILIIFQLQSNKRSSQSVMIDNGLIQEIVDKLDKQRDTMTTFIMEYATALLLNLLLSKKGLDRAQQIKSQILMSLINLMQTESTSVKSFVHAGLYPLLSRKTFREKALQFGMQENIKYLLQNNPSIQFQHQLKYVYERLMMQNDIQQEKDEQPQFDQINDDEIGQDYEFGIEQINSSLSGQFFLMKKYPLTGPQAIKQLNNIKQDVKSTFSKSIYYQRDVTDRQSAVQTPLLGKGRRSHINMNGLTHNNSVYSNKSSNRVLRSEKNSRIKNNGGGGDGGDSNKDNNRNSREKLDTVQQNGSEASLKEYNHNNNNQFGGGGQQQQPMNSKKNNNSNNNSISNKNPFKQFQDHQPNNNNNDLLLSSPNNNNNNNSNSRYEPDNVLEMENAEGTFRQKHQYSNEHYEDQNDSGSFLKEEKENQHNNNNNNNNNNNFSNNNSHFLSANSKNNSRVIGGGGQQEELRQFQHDDQNEDGRGERVNRRREATFSDNNNTGGEGPNHNNPSNDNGNGIPQKKLKPYQKTQEYSMAFKTRKDLVRTPPQK